MRMISPALIIRIAIASTRHRATANSYSSTLTGKWRTQLGRLKAMTIKPCFSINMIFWQDSLLSQKTIVPHGNSCGTNVEATYKHVHGAPNDKLAIKVILFISKHSFYNCWLCNADALPDFIP